MGQVPDYYDHKPSRIRSYVTDDSTPLYPFGYGLSYASFDYKNLQVSPSKIAPSGSAAVSVDVTNTGAVKADEIVQLYIHAVVALPTRPVEELKDFQRITLGPGEKRTVTFSLTPDKLEAYDLNMKRTVQPGDFEILRRRVLGRVWPSLAASGSSRPLHGAPRSRTPLASAANCANTAACDRPRRLCIGFVLGIVLAGVMTLLFGVYTIGPTERGVPDATFRARAAAERLGSRRIRTSRLLLTAEELLRYNFPLIHVVKPGGPYFKWPWQRLYRIDMTIQTTDIVWDPDINQSLIEAVTKDNLTINLTGQIRWKPCERNLYGYLFGVARPRAHVMGYFISVLRDRIATFHSQGVDSTVDGISINDLRKNLDVINQFMESTSWATSSRFSATG